MTDRVEKLEQTLKDTHITVIQPDREGKPIYEECHIVAESAHNLALELTQLFPQPLDGKGLEKALLTDEEIGNLEWESTDLWMGCVEDLKENHPKEFKALLKAQRDKALALLQPKIEEARRQERERIIEEMEEDIKAGLALGEKSGDFKRPYYRTECFLQTLKGGE